MAAEKVGKMGIVDDLADFADLEKVENVEPTENLKTAEIKNLEETAENVEKLEVDENLRDVQNVEPVKSNEIAENSDNLANSEDSKTGENSQNAENVEKSELLDDLGKVENVAPVEIFEDVEDVENSESAEIVETAKKVENVAPAEIVEIAEIAKTAENPEKLGFSEDLKKVENVAPAEIPKTAEKVEIAEPAEKSEIAKPAEIVENPQNVLLEIFPKLADLPQLTWLQEIPIKYAAFLYYGHISPPPQTPINPMNKANILYAAINTQDFFVIHAKACTCELFGDVVRKLLGESDGYNPPEISFEQYRQRLILQNRPNFAILDDISNVTTELAKYATTCAGLVDSINNIYFAAIPFLQNAELREFVSLLTKLRAAGGKSPYITESDKTAIFQLLEKFTPILRERIQEKHRQNKPDFYRYLAEITPKSTHGKIRPLDGSQAFVAENIAVVDVDVCEELPIADKYIIIGDKSQKFLQFANAAKSQTENDKIGRFAEIGEDKPLNFRRLNKNNVLSHIMEMHEKGNSIGVLDISENTKKNNGNFEIAEISEIQLDNVKIGGISDLYRYNFDIVYITAEHEKWLNIANAKARHGLFVII